MAASGEFSWPPLGRSRWPLTLLETFVVAQLRAQAEVSEKRPTIYHLRELNGRHEIDVLMELGGRDVIAVEIKADSAPGPDASRHLRWLQERLSDRFLCGIVFHTGSSRFDMDRKIFALPICALWG